MTVVEIRCVSERKRFQVTDPTYKVTSIGSIRVVGKCPSCGREIGEFTSADKAPTDVRKKSADIRAKRSAKSKKGGNSRPKSRGASRKSSSKRN